MLRSPAIILASALLACALLAACGSQPAATVAREPAAAVAADIPERHFPDDSLYALLVAEFALRRGDYEVALDQYMAQSPLLRDGGVSAHTTHLSQFLRRDEANLEAARLWVELEPDNPEAHNTLARQLVRSGQSRAALPHLAAIERLGQPANFPVVLGGLPGLSAAEREALSAALEELQREFPHNSRLLLTQALLYHEQGQHQRALQRLGLLFAAEPEQTQALLLEASILVDTGARKPYAHLEEVLQRKPQDKSLRLHYARLLASDDLPRAREQFEILAAQAPADPDLLYSLALINRQLDDPQAASGYLHQLIQLGQRVDEARYQLGRVAEDRGDREAALKHYQSVASGREYLAANSRIGEILLDSGQLQRSRDWFQQQRTAHADQRAQLFALEAQLLSQNGEPASAINLLDAALRDSPGDADLLYSRAMLHEQQNELGAMEADLRAILAREPDNATALNALGYTLANRTDRYREALSLLEQALALQPGEPAILDSMGWVLYRLQRHQEALDFLGRAYAAMPDPEIAAHFGEVLWVTGDSERALEVWRAAALRAPQHEVLRSTLQRLGVDAVELPASPVPPRGD